MDLLYPFLFSLFLCSFFWIVAGAHVTKGAILVALMLTINSLLWGLVWYIGDQFMLIRECLIRIPS